MKIALTVIVIISLFVGRFLLEKQFGEINTILLIFIGICLISVIGWAYEKVKEGILRTKKNVSLMCGSREPTSRFVRSDVEKKGKLIISDFRNSLGNTNGQTIEDYIEKDISEIIDLSESERLYSWLSLQKSSGGAINLFEYATASVMPSNPTDTEHDDILSIMEDLFFKHAEDLPMKATGAMTIEETLQDMKDYFQGKIDKA